MRELDDGGEHVKERNEVEDDGCVDEELIGTAGGVVDLADEQDRTGDNGLHEDRDVRRLPSRMNFAEGRGQVAVDANNKRNTRDAGDSAADSAGVADGDEDGGEHSQRADAQRD